MQIRPVTDTAFLQATMTIDAIRQECLFYAQGIGELQEQNKLLKEQTENLLKELQEKESIIADHWGEVIEGDTEDEVMSAIKAAIDPGHHTAGAIINLEHGRTIYLPPGRYTLTGARDTPEDEES